LAQYRPNVREESMVSSLDRHREQERYHVVSHVRDNIDRIAEQITVKLIENRFVETARKGDLESQIHGQLEKAIEADEFDIQYQTANIRNLVPSPNFISLFVTAFIIEKLTSFDWILDVYGTDDEIYRVVHQQVAQHPGK
jgi:hypothetical protein